MSTTVEGAILGKRKSLSSDLAKVDAHEIQPHEYDELPELTDALIKDARRRGLVKIDFATNDFAADPLRPVDDRPGERRKQPLKE